MALAARRDARMSVPEFRAWAESRPERERWELLDGAPALMAPPTERHQRIVMNLARRLDELAERRGCRALPGLAVVSAAMDDFAPIPDVVVRCGPPRPDGYAEDPVLVAEVLSPSTMSRDRGRKTDFYRAVPSLATFLIVYADEPRVEVWRRAGAEWSVAALGPDGAVALPDLGGSVPVAAIYRDITF
ncbi:Uma2 family endonuclease [Methylobacterium sp. NEAU 140]|uniref:Uma2 family endonuclease n=1 Tax=Methylobacterium sp. NEAU 140 TaxID=3064945 RepID=UPI002736CF9B|nr:Uma2 family endonuclease [Methylobacterium sp. NEAU 140]MDP4024370.1 Uma2 family endonuclease [Methylobacterium sp. NEAU 140]